MKQFGVFICVAALVALVFGFTYDTSVATGLGGRVHNVGLMNERQNIIIVGAAMLVAGALLLGLSSRGQSPAVTEGSPGYRRCPSCAEMVKDDAKVCRYCQRDLPSLSELREKEESERQRLAEVQLIKDETARQVEEKLPKGICPNCKKAIPLASLECKHCAANFEHGSAWHVLPLSDS